MIPLRLSLGQWSPVIRRLEGEPHKAAMALTFDDGPEPSSTPALIATLKDAGAKASFFLCGVRIERHPELVAGLVAGGHEVYAHGWDHQRYGDGDADAAVEAMARTEALLARHRPTPKTYLVRLPFNAGFRSPRMHRAMRRFHPDIQFAWWSHAIADFHIAGSCRGESEIRAAIDAAIAAFLRRNDLAGGVLLLHDAPIDQPAETAGMTTRLLVPALLQALKAKSIDLVALQPFERSATLGRFAFRSPEPFMVVPPVPKPA